MKTSHSLSTRLSLYIAIAVLSIFLLFFGGISVFSTRLLSDEVISSANKSLSNVTSNVDNILGGVESAAHSQLWLIMEHLDEPDYLFHLTKEYVRENPFVVGSTVAFVKDYFKGQKYFAPYSCIDTDGSIKSFQMGNENYDYFGMEWFNAPYSLGKSIWSDPYDDEGGGEMVMTTYSIPVKDADGRIIAIFTSDVTLSDLTQEVSSNLQYKDSFTMILDRGGRYICHRDTSYLLVKSIFDIAAETGRDQIAEMGEQMLNGQQGIAKIKNEANKRAFVIYGPLSNGWSAGIVCQYDDVFANLNSLINNIFIFILLGGLLIYLVSKRIIRRLTQPVTEFTYTAMNIAKGNFNATIPQIKTQDELYRLSKSMSYMLDSVNQYMTELQRSTASNERFESELTIASNIQSAMLSRDFPSIRNVDMFASLTPAKEVGGDLYDFLVKDNNVIYFCIGDVSGKGVPAALYMAITKSAFHFIAGMGLEVDDIMSKINDALTEGNEMNMFVTMFIGKINLDTMEMEYCNGGHNPIIIVAPDGKARYLHAKANLASGLFAGFPYQKETIQLSKGSRILLYTDGITEAEDKVQNQYGEDRLLDFVNNEDNSTPSGIYIEDLLSSVKDFTGSNPQNDDITAFTIRL